MTRPRPSSLTATRCLVSAVALALALVVASLPAAAQPLYPNGKTFHCDFTRANGTTGTGVVSFNMNGTLGKQTGTLTNQVGSWSATPAIELTMPRWEGNRKVWSYRQPAENLQCRFSTWAQTILWDNCSNGNRQICTESGMSKIQQTQNPPAYLVLKQLLLEEDHEDFGAFGNDPEIEMFIADPSACGNPPCFTVRSTTPANLAFTQVDNKNQWYTINTGIPVQVGQALVLIEDDDQARELRLNFSGLGIFCFPNAPNDPDFAASLNSSGVGYCTIATPFGNLQSLWGGNDDEFKGMVVVTNGLDLYNDLTIDAGEWRIRIGATY